MAVPEEVGLTHAWNYFSFHASQRITVFNFFIVFSGLILAGLGAVLQGAPRLSFFGVALGLLLVLLSAVFWQLDRRVSFMIKHSEAALTIAEKAILPQELQIVESEPAAFARARARRWLWTYGDSFRIIFSAMAVIGLGGATLSLCQYVGWVDWAETSPEQLAQGRPAAIAPRHQGDSAIPTNQVEMNAASRK